MVNIEISVPAPPSVSISTGVSVSQQAKIENLEKELSLLFESYNSALSEIETLRENVDIAFRDGASQSQSDFWDAFQNNGERTDYSYAFVNWRHEEISPKHPIYADKITYCFMGCENIEDLSNTTITLTAKKPNMMYAFVNCAKLVTPPALIFESCPIVKTYTSMYAGCQSLESVSVYWGDGTQDPITQRSSCQNMFFKCYSLKNVDFGAEETGSPLYLDLSDCTSLTIDSFNSLLTSLKTIDTEQASSENSVHEITVSVECLKNILDNTAVSGLITGFKNKGWSLLTPDGNKIISLEYKQTSVEMGGEVITTDEYWQWSFETSDGVIIIEEEYEATVPEDGDEGNTEVEEW
ncbi:MAG: hypothetical protein IJD30_05370 [Clostridia bacterium]|nr:hypothetical protein [Clostridia bacterium]